MLVCLLYMSIIATALVVLVEQTVLKFITAREAAILYSFEPLFGVLCGAAFYNEPLGPNALVAATLMIAASSLSE
jgi:threonine/homoserine efflux transporter RhtA